MGRRSTPWLLSGLALLLAVAAAVLARLVRHDGPGFSPVEHAASPALTEAYDGWLAVSAHTFVRDRTWLVDVTEVFAVLGSWVVMVPLTIGIVVRLYRQGHRSWALWVGLCGMGGWMVSQSVKHLMDRERPVWQDPFEVLTSPSFPSGHSMVGVYGYVVFGIVVLALGRRRWPGVVLIVFGMLMGPSRVVLGVHWPSDVLAGWLFAGAWVCVATVAVFRRPEDDEQSPGGPRGSISSPGLDQRP